ncbi:MAG: hypothetical protein JWM68_4227, partial [Verrucomicrobiales bacterium]|nr:hypothetical protein [Verrucomicrobiales bacterium]
MAQGHDQDVLVKGARFVYLFEISASTFSAVTISRETPVSGRPKLPLSRETPVLGDPKLPLSHETPVSGDPKLPL